VVPLRLAVILGLITSLGAFYQWGKAVNIKLFTDRGVGRVGIGHRSHVAALRRALHPSGHFSENISPECFHEVRGRPRFIVRDAVGFDGRTVAEDGGESTDFRSFERRIPGVTL
jgi:hypothetical protein